MLGTPRGAYRGGYRWWPWRRSGELGGELKDGIICAVQKCIGKFDHKNGQRPRCEQKGEPFPAFPLCITYLALSLP